MGLVQSQNHMSQHILIGYLRVGEIPITIIYHMVITRRKDTINKDKAKLPSKVAYKNSAIGY